MKKHLVPILLLAQALSACGESPPPNPDTDVHGAWAYMQLFVEDQLKSPSSADFPFGGFRDVTALGGGRYKVVSHVDSQNSFGATIRTNFEGVIERLDGKWKLEYLTFDE